jgi:DNA polymerase I-like protein with 3'-5' exonuclease and polymerase domains
VYSQWKDKVNELYRKRGYIETHFGFRFKGYMPYRKVTNYPIQATAFHCLLWTLINVSKIAKEEKWKSKICGQIHDSMFIDCVPEEMEHIMKTVNKVGTEDIRKFDWICVPLKIDFEGTEINQPWYTKKEIKI